MRTSETTVELFSALSKAQGSFRNPEKNKTVKVTTNKGGTYSYNYADLPAIYDASRKPLAENGLGHSFGLRYENNQCFLVGRLFHSSGEWMETDYLLMRTGDIKAFAAEITYGKRYVICMLIGMAADEDTDNEPQPGASYGNKPKPRAAPSQSDLYGMITSLREKLNLSNEDLKSEIFREFGKSSAKELSRDQLEKFVMILNTEANLRMESKNEMKKDDNPSKTVNTKSLGPQFADQTTSTIGN